MERFEAKLDGTEDDDGTRVGAAGSCGLFVELVGVVGNEVGTQPVALEHGLELGENVGVAGRRGADVPLEPGDLGGVGEVGRADVGGREAGAAVEDPGLGVEAGGAEVVGDADVGAEAGELVERGSLRGAGVGGGENAQRPAALTVATKRGEQRVDAAAPDERHDDVDGIGRIDLGIELVQQSGLTGRIGEKGRVEQWNERLGNRLWCAVGPTLEDGVQDLARLDRCGGRVGFNEFGKSLDELACHLDPDLDAVGVTNTAERLPDLPAQMKRDPIRGLRRSKRLGIVRATLEVAPARPAVPR